MNITNIQKRKQSFYEDWLFEMNGEVYFYSTMPEQTVRLSKHIKAAVNPARTILWTSTIFLKEPVKNRCLSQIYQHMPLDPTNPKKGIEKFLKLILLQ